MPNLDHLPTPYRIAEWGFGVGNVAIAAVLLWAIFAGLPTRSPLVDMPAVLVGLLLVTSGVALMARWPHRVLLLRVSAAMGLAIGLTVIAALALSAAFLSGTHGQLGQSGALTLTLIMALAIPYFLLYPCVQLLWIHAQRKREHPTRSEGA